MIRRTFLIGLMLTLASNAFSEGWINRDGTPVPDELNRKADGKFGAWLVLIDDEEKFFREWETTQATVQIETASRIERNKFITAIVVFSGCSSNPEGGCDVSGSFEITQPDDSNYAFIPPQRAWPKNTPLAEGNLLMSQLYLRIRIEPGEPLGIYTVRAILEDLMTGKELILEAPFEAYESAT
jgi:hypothetical protein